MNLSLSFFRVSYVVLLFFSDDDECLSSWFKQIYILFRNKQQARYNEKSHSINYSIKNTEKKRERERKKKRNKGKTQELTVINLIECLVFLFFSLHLSISTITITNNTNNNENENIFFFKNYLVKLDIYKDWNNEQELRRIKKKKKKKIRERNCCCFILFFSVLFGSDRRENYERGYKITRKQHWSRFSGCFFVSFRFKGFLQFFFISFHCCCCVAILVFETSHK